MEVYKMEQGFCSSLEISFCLLLFDLTPLLSEPLNTLKLDLPCTASFISMVGRGLGLFCVCVCVGVSGVEGGGGWARPLGLL